MHSPVRTLRFKRIGTRLGAGFGVVMVIMLLMAGVAATQLWRIQALNAAAAHDAERMSLVQHWSALVRTNLDRALTATRLDGAVGDDASMHQRLSPVLGQLKEDMSSTATATGVLQKRVNDLSNEADIATLISAVNRDRARFVAVRAQVRDDIQMGDGARRIDTELVPLATAMLRSLDALEAYLERRSSQASATLHAVVARAKIVLFASSVAALLAAAVLAWLTTHSITAPMRDAVAIAEHIANGDLTKSITTDRPDELGSLLRRLSRMQQQLQATFGEIRRSADSILTASAEVATGNADLSQRTEQTASSLQQTASSIEQLAGNVSHSTASARDADQLAKSAAEAAGRGGAAVGRVVTTMDEISASSRQIAEIIGVIDGIAFQTNILALNAAVEAARAGEQGRGFAVVASEVRGLAHRSADAARQIKVLIDASVERVEQGARLVGEAGQTMTQLVDGVRRVSDVVGEITARSGRQSEGLGEVNAAVGQIDRMTQRNAALVEQSAAAAESLKDQARSLADALAQFRLQPA